MASYNPQPQKREALDTLLEKADVQGYLTTGDIMEVFPWDGEDDERLLELFGFLHHQGIEIVIEEEAEPEPDLTKLDVSTLDFNPASLDTVLMPNLESISADDSVGLYLKEMSRVPLLTLDEEVNLAQRIELAKEAKLDFWYNLFGYRMAAFLNMERPHFMTHTPVDDKPERVLSRRNSFFWMADQAGNQLPYIDEIHIKFFADAQALNLAAIAGELDEQERHINLLNYPVLKEKEQKQGKYKIFLWSSPGGFDAGVIFNQTYAKDSELAKVMANKDFRIAMSYAINRKQINESAFLGTGEPRQGIPKKGHPYYPGDEYAFKYTQYDPAKANQMLDAIGLDKKDAEGFRLLPSGKRLMIELSVVEVFGPYRDIATLVTKDFEKVGVKVNMQIRERSLHFQMRQANDLQAEMWNQDTAGFPFTGSTKYDFRKDLYGNLTYGPLWKQWYDTNGKEGVEPPAEAKMIIELQDRAKTVGPAEQAKIAQELFKVWVDNMFEIGTVGLTATDQGVAVVNAKLHNVPEKLTKDWPLRTPGNGRPEVWFFK